MCGHDDDGVIVNKARQVFDVHGGIQTRNIARSAVFKKKSHSRLGNVSFPPPPKPHSSFPFLYPRHAKQRVAVRADGWRDRRGREG